MRLARKPSPRGQRHSLEPDHRRRAGASEKRDLGWLLAPERGMSERLDELPVVAIDALLRKREQIADKIKELERQAAGLRSDLMHIDHTLRVIDPSYSPGKKAPRLRFSTVGYFEHGELS